MKKQIYAIYERCSNCKGCEVACQREHDGISFIRVVPVEDRFAVPLTCRQCDPAPCAMACPTGALNFEGDGVGLDAAKCTGCTLCLFACPFGVLHFDTAVKVAANCDLCAVRQKQGDLPACVLTCPSSALRYGDYNGHVAGARHRASAEILRAQSLKGGVR
jgi:formate dehydrogenase iron-sulfur subunit